MTHGSTQHAPRSFGLPPQEAEPKKPNPIDLDDYVAYLRHKRNGYEFELRSRGRKPSTIQSLKERIEKTNNEIESLGYTARGPKGRRKKGQIR